jgi:hypothetical protein
MYDVSYRLGCQFLKRRQHNTGVLRRLTGIDQNDSFLSLDDRDIRIVELPGVDVNPLFEVLEMRPRS